MTGIEGAAQGAPEVLSMAELERQRELRRRAHAENAEQDRCAVAHACEYR